MANENQGIPDRNRFSAGLLRAYLVYRFLLSLLLLCLYIGNFTPQVIGGFAPDLYLGASIIYLVACTLTLGFYQLQHNRLNLGQLLLTLLTDIALQTLLTFASGGLTSGIGYLMIVTVAAGAIFFTGQLAILIPAVGSICIIAESLLATMLFGRDNASVLPSGVLGIFLFLTSLLFSRLSHALIIAQQTAETESELSAELQELNEMIINRMRTGIVVVDEQLGIQQINHAALELMGYIPQGGQELNINDRLKNESKLMQRLEQWKNHADTKAEPFISELGNTELQANFASLDHSDRSRTIIFLEDARAAAQQAQQLKLASLGRLTGSIAHEIRNPLGAISHASELLNELQEGDKDITRLTQIVNTHVKRVNHIVESVMQLSRQEYADPHWLPIGP